MSVRQATVESVNVVFAQLGLDVGPENIAKTAYEMGITRPSTPSRPTASAACVGVTPLEQADAYATLANGGVHHRRPRSAGSCSRTATPTSRARASGKRVLSDGRPTRSPRCSKGVITSGTGAGYTSIGCPEAGKTGTSEGVSDAWFVGYTPKIRPRSGPGTRLPRHHRLRRPHLRPDLAVLHVGGAGQLLRRLPTAAEPDAVLELLERLTHGLLPGLAGIVEQLECPGHPRAADGHRGLDHGGRERLSPQLYAPGAGQGPSPTPQGNGGGRDRRKSLGSE